MVGFCQARLDEVKSPNTVELNQKIMKHIPVPILLWNCWTTDWSTNFGSSWGWWQVLYADLGLSKALTKSLWGCDRVDTVIAFCGTAIIKMVFRLPGNIHIIYGRGSIPCTPSEHQKMLKTVGMFIHSFLGLLVINDPYSSSIKQGYNLGYVVDNPLVTLNVWNVTKGF